VSAKVSQQDRVCPKGCYVYAIYVDGVLRYIGKGTNGRMYAHMKEVRQRLTRKFCRARRRFMRQVGAKIAADLQ
jgi:hypothetical protein